MAISIRVTPENQQEVLTLVSNLSDHIGLCYKCSEAKRYGTRDYCPTTVEIFKDLMKIAEVKEIENPNV